MSLSPRQSCTSATVSPAMRMGITLALVAGLGGCAHHTAGCPGEPEAGRYELLLEASGDVPDGTPREVRLVVELPESIGAITCDTVAEERTACGGSAATHCELQDHLHRVIGTFDAQLDLSWTEDGAVGGASVLWRDADGTDLGEAEYDATLSPE